MRPARVVALAVGLVVLAGCSGETPVSAPADGSTVSAASASESLSTPVSTAGGGKLQVTVPGLGGGSSVSTSEAVPSGAVSSGVDVPSFDAEAPSSPEAPSSEPEDGVASGTSAAGSPAVDGTVDVELVGCDDCQVLGTHADVVGSYSAALISQGGRAAIISVDPSGALVAVQSVPYGVTFAAQPDGRLACGAGGRCMVRAAQSDGRAVLSAFGLGADGEWTDLSGSDGFVSATDKALPVMLEDALGAAVQVTDGTTTIWNVLAWNGSTFATLGCGPGGDVPDLTTLDLAACLS